jgi:succinate dehydrogenase, cytochrome b556 subunit
VERTGNAPGRTVRSFADLNPRYYRTGMWSHVLHRISGIAIVVFLLLHIWEITTVVRAGAEGFSTKMASMAARVWVIGEWFLFLALVFHGINGIRLILLDLGSGSAHAQAQLLGSPDPVRSRRRHRQLLLRHALPGVPVDGLSRTR